MALEDEILDEAEMRTEDTPVQNFNYRKYVIIYLFLMTSIGALLTNLLNPYDLTFFHLLIGALSYALTALAFALVQELISSIYFRITKKSRKSKHPQWFRILENCFYIWCIIVILTFVGNKLV